MSGMVSDEVLGEFLSECEEIIQRVSSAFSIIEKNEHDFELLDAVYRDMHTLKGSSYLFGFTNIGQLAHVMETCLDPLRQKDTHYTVSSEFLAILDESLGIFEHIMGRLAENQGDKGFESEVGKAFHKLIDRATRNYGRDFQLVNNGVYPDED